MASNYFDPKVPATFFLKSDSKVVVQACTSEDGNYGNYTLTSRIKEILHMNWRAHVIHIYRESNTTTHALAILARSQK
ncbi:hypothetical protein PVK06_035651 [Gossypium arboreum]|uniref:RNase H type-1 domain-containing protein n=1 Tax=Gossypium arboreum TaxID=29729 RepID=A0ABR0NHD0_GOSAR|nr:hypothetical protein PVK06_035651 [Gossypium arboreum]